MQRTSKQVISFSASLLVIALLIWLTGINQKLFLILNTYGSLLPDWFWANMTLMGDTMMAITLLLILASIKPKVFSQGMLLLIIGGSLVYFAKKQFGVERPAATISQEDFNIIGHVLKHGSFPSGHSFTALSMLTIYAYQIRKTWATITFLILGLSFALSRIMVGAHWPLDMLVGSALGALTAMLCVFMSLKIKPLTHSALIYFFAFIISLTVLFFPFYDSEYPNTQYLQLLATLIAMLVAVRFYWWPKLSGKEKAEAKWREIKPN